jgi:NADH-quinone oxidoreductase subunit F
VAEIIAETLTQDKIIERLNYTDLISGKKISREADIPFHKAQERTILGQNKLVDPCNINDYIAQGGYLALIKVLTSMKPDEVIEEIKESGLRGRGGGWISYGKEVGILPSS